MSTALLQRKRVVVLGGANTDVFGRPDKPLEAHDSNPGRISRSPGGVARNIAENLARLGVHPILITAFGSDADGRELERACRAARIDTTPSLICADLAGSVYLAILDDEGDMEVAVSDMRALDRLTVRVLQSRRQMLQSCQLVIADTNLPEESLVWLGEQVDGRLLVDLVSTAKAPRAAGMLAHLAGIKGNVAEVAALLGEDEPEDDAGIEKLVATLLEAGPRLAFVTAGSRGVCCCARGGEALWLGAPDVHIANASGAGDAFTAGVAAGILKSDTLGRTAQIGTLLAGVTLASESTVSERVTPQLLVEAEREWNNQ